MKNKMFKTITLSLVMLLLSACFPAKDVNGKKEFLIQGRTMGTTYNIKVVATDEQIDLEELKADIDEALVEVNNQMSTYQSDSEITQFNQSTTLTPMPISQGFVTVVKEAIRLGKLTEGKLDVTVGPLVNLWGFGPAYKPEKVPSVEQQEQARERIGIDKLILTEQGLAKTQADLYLDLSTIAKGWGVDVIAQLLSEKGINNYLVEVGGEMRLKGFKHTGELWVIAIEKPVSNVRAVHQYVVPKDNAVATSGDYRNYYEVDGQRFSHIIDPDSGKPIEHKLVSVTVIHPSSMTADGLSTAMMVMGEKQAIAFAEKHDIAAYIIAKTENGFVEQSTVKFMQYLK